ncbi:MAG: universal stress protein [Rhodospirillales bacterium]|nr:universal stress protein [Rhodospirillales bacterium]
MRKILVATDLSARADRAIRRATLLAKKFEASLHLVHVVDDDRPRRIIDPERDAAAEILDKQARSLRDFDGVNCTASVVLGGLADEIVKAAQEAAADVVIVGSHRHRAIQDVFVGTTAERTIRSSRQPLLVANGVPASLYRHILAAVDFSNCSADALLAIAALGLDKDVAISVLHVFDAPARKHMALASASRGDLQHYIGSEEADAGRELASFVQRTVAFPARHLVKLRETTAPHAICTAAEEVSADLIVVGTHGRTGIANFLLGSVAQGVLHAADQDVLTIPARRD